MAICIYNCNFGNLVVNLSASTSMKRFLILTFGILIMHSAFADKGINDAQILSKNKEKTSLTKTNLPSNYQDFKYLLLNHNTKRNAIPAVNYRGGDDYTMLYVAGGIAIVTTSFIMINGKNKYTGDFGTTNTGMLIGGSISTATLVTKFFIDKFR